MHFLLFLATKGWYFNGVERDYFWKSEVVINKQYFTDRLYSFGVNKKKTKWKFLLSSSWFEHISFVFDCKHVTIQLTIAVCQNFSHIVDIAQSLLLQFFKKIQQVHQAVNFQIQKITSVGSTTKNEVYKCLSSFYQIT